MLLSLRIHPDQSESVVAGLVCVGVDCCPDLVAEVKKFLLTSRLGQLAIAVGIVAPGTSENPKTRCIPFINNGLATYTTMLHIV